MKNETTKNTKVDYTTNGVGDIIVKHNGNNVFIGDENGNGRPNGLGLMMKYNLDQEKVDAAKKDNAEFIANYNGARRLDNLQNERNLDSGLK